MIPSKDIDIEVESIVFDPRPTACVECGSKEDLRSICGLVICKECLLGDF